MYVTHGDTIVIRSDRPGRFGTSSRLGPRDEWGDGRRDPFSARYGRQQGYPSHRPDADDAARLQALRERIDVLEDRVSRLEARLARAAEDGKRPWRTDGHRPGGGAPPVRVTLQAGGGAHASVGEVRLIQHG